MVDHRHDENLNGKTFEKTTVDGSPALEQTEVAATELLGADFTNLCTVSAAPLL